MDSTTSPKNDYEFFNVNSDFPYPDDMLHNFAFTNPDGLHFNALQDYYPQTIAPSALTSSPKVLYHRPATAVTTAANTPAPLAPVTRGGATGVQLNAHRLSSPEDNFLNIRESSSSPSSSEPFHPVPLPPLSHTPRHQHSHHHHSHSFSGHPSAPPPGPPLHYLSSGHLSSASLSGGEGSPTVVGLGLRESPLLGATVLPSAIATATSNMHPPRSPANSIDGAGSGLKPSPKTRNGGGLVHRHQPQRAATIASSRPQRRGSGAGSRVRQVKEEEDWTEFEEDEDFQLTGHQSSYSREGHDSAGGSGAKPERRRDDIRKQRIESEQRRRDELREGYNRLKSALPPSNQKSSKASILERATVAIGDLNGKVNVLAARVEELEQELRRVRVLNETLMLSAAEHRNAAHQAQAQYAAVHAHLTPNGYSQTA